MESGIGVVYNKNACSSVCVYIYNSSLKTLVRATFSGKEPLSGCLLYPPTNSVHYKMSKGSLAPLPP